MRRAAAGFTLIELMIVVAIIAIIAAVAIPNLLSARVIANETAAISTLRSINSAQSQFQASTRCDLDIDGSGEFGVFRELSGAAAVRTASDGTNTGGTVLTPAALSGSFRTLAPLASDVSRSGYLFHVFLPGPSATTASEPPSQNGAFTGALVDVNLSESCWTVYAWPEQYGTSGNRSFFLNQSGDILNTEASAYSGTGEFTTSTAGAAYAVGGSLQSITGRVAIGTIGRDGNRWKSVN